MGRFANGFKILGCLITNGRVVHFVFSPFDSVVFAKTTLVVHLWQTGVMVLTRANKIVRLVVGATGRWVDRRGCVIIIVTRSKTDMGTMSGLTSFVMAIILFIVIFG